MLNETMHMVESHELESFFLNCWSRSRVFKNAGVEVGSRFFKTSGVGVRSWNPKKSSDSTTLCITTLDIPTLKN